MRNLYEPIPLMHNKKFIFYILMGIAFIDWASFGLVYPIFSSMLFSDTPHLLESTATAGEKGVWLGILLAASPLAQFFSSPIFGTLSDQKGRKPLLKVGLIIMTIGYLLSMLGVASNSLLFLLLSRIIVGISMANAAVVNAAVADISKPEEKPRHFALINMAYGLGFTVGPFLGGILSSWGGFYLPFLLSAAVCFINFLLVLLCFQETHLVKKTSKLDIALGIKNLKQAFQPGHLRALFLCMLIFSIGWSFYWEFIPVTWIQVHHLTTKEVGFLYGFGAGIYALSCAFLVKPIAKKYPSIRILFVALILLGALILLLLFTHHVGWFIFYIPLQQMAIALAFPTGVALISNEASSETQGEMMGILQSVESFAFAATPLLAGGLIGLTQNMPLLVGGVCMFLASLMLLQGYRSKIFRAPL